MSCSRFALLALMSINLCFAAKARLYNLETGEVLEMKFSRAIFGGGHGKISLKLADGMILQGEYSAVPEGSTSWGRDLRHGYRT